MAEQVEPGNSVERRRFLRDVEMDLPNVGDEFELNVAKGLMMVTVTDINRHGADGPPHVRINNDKLTFAMLRDDERWIEKLL